VAAKFALAEVTLVRRFRTDRITGVPLEPGGCIAIPDPSEDALTIWAPSQAPHIMRTIVAECLKMPESMEAKTPADWVMLDSTMLECRRCSDRVESGRRTK
jgi:CO/xanthine dehydrogenase Mo-binding subunit